MANCRSTRWNLDRAFEVFVSRNLLEMRTIVLKRVHAQHVARMRYCANIRRPPDAAIAPHAHALMDVSVSIDLGISSDLRATRYACIGEHADRVFKLGMLADDCAFCDQFGHGFSGRKVANSRLDCM